MFTYQARPRVFRSRTGKQPTFPNRVELSFYFQPLQPFGMAPGGGLTTVKDSQTTGRFNAYTGQYSVEAAKPLKPLHAIIEMPIKMCWEGNRLTVTTTCDSWDSMRALINSVYFGLPLLLGVEFVDPPFVERVEGVAGGVPFTWELSRWSMISDATTQQLQTERLTQASNRFRMLMDEHRVRLVGALHYFHIACRLRREAKTPGEFLAESLLNLHRVLEVLYGPNRDTVRSALGKLGYTIEEIERDFIPAMLLRNSIDVGHPGLALLKPEQLQTVQRYADKAEFAFRRFLQRLIQEAVSGRAEVPPYEIREADSDLAQTIETLRGRLDPLMDEG